jgi:hypothetical protein
MKVLLEDTICLQKTKVLYLCLFFALLFTSIFCLFVLFLFQGATATVPTSAFPSLEKQREPIEKQIPKNLALKPHNFPLFFPDLTKEIHVALKNSRPDSDLNQMPLVLSLRSSQEKKTIASQEKVFLKPPQNSQDRKFHFSSFPTPIAFTASWADTKKVLLQLAIEKKQFPGVVFSKQFSSEFFIEPEQPKETLEKEDFFRSLSLAKWWGKDALVSTFFPEQEEQQRLEIFSESPSEDLALSAAAPAAEASLVASEFSRGPDSADFSQVNECNSATASIILIKEKDYLIWKKSFWQKIDSLQKAKGYPLAKIVSIQPEKLEIFSWNETGEKQGKIVLSLQTTEPIKKEEIFLTEIHLRSKNQLSAKIEKQRILLKTKSFAYRKAGRWRVVKKAPFSERFEKLFFLEKIQEEAEGKSIVGYFFDSSHTQKEEVKIFIPSTHPKRALQKFRNKTQKAFFPKELFPEAACS